MAVSRQTNDGEIRGGTLAPATFGRYQIFDEIGVGGMASVHLGLLSGAAGFQRVVAIKRLHPQFAGDPTFRDQFVDEARLAARIRHSNVVQTLDVLWTGDQLLLVLEYVEGDTLSQVLKSVAERGEQVPIEIACGVVVSTLHGLHAAHNARDEQGRGLNIVHRDVSPQNILVARDGLVRVLDFGIAKAKARSHHTEAGVIKGKFGYMTPEQVKRGPIDCRTDVFAAGIVLWEALTCRRLFPATGQVEKVLARIVSGEVEPPSQHRPELPPVLDAIVLKAAAKEPKDRYQTAEEFAIALEQATGVANARQIRAWFEPLASHELVWRAHRVELIDKLYANPPAVLPATSVTRPVTSADDAGAEPTRQERPPVPQWSQQEVTQASPGSEDPAASERETPAVPASSKPGARVARRRIPLGVVIGFVALLGALAGIGVTRRLRSVDDPAQQAAGDVGTTPGEPAGHDAVLHDGARHEVERDSADTTAEASSATTPSPTGARPVAPLSADERAPTLPPPSATAAMPTPATTLPTGKPRPIKPARVSKPKPAPPKPLPPNLDIRSER